MQRPLDLLRGKTGPDFANAINHPYLTTPMKTTSAPLLLAASLCSTLFPVLPAGAAGCDPAAFDNGSTFRYSICNVPDIDQIRSPGLYAAGLPNDGKMYCGPTSSLNWLAYIANHGFPSLAPGYGYWGPETTAIQPRYNAMTQALSVMGAVMGTHMTGGTSGGGLYGGLNAWLSTPAAGGAFVVTEHAAGGFFAPRFADLGHAAAAGGLVIPVVGWYKRLADTLPQWAKDVYFWEHGFYPPGLVRDGGHILTMVGAQNEFGQQQIQWNDPARQTTGNNSNQSSFHEDGYEVVDEFDIFDGKPRWQSRIKNYGAHAYLDGYFVISPMSGLSAHDSTFHDFKLKLNLKEGSGLSLEHRDFHSATGGRIRDLAVPSDSTGVPYLIEGDNSIWRLDRRTGASTRWTTLPQPKRLAFGGREERLHVLLARELVSLDRDGAVKVRIALVSPLAAIAYGETADRLYAVDERAGYLWSFDAGLKAAERYPLRLPVPPRGPVSLRVDPVSGDILLHSEGSPSVFRIALPGMRAGVSRPGVVGVQTGAFAPSEQVPPQPDLPPPALTEVRLEGARQPRAFAVDHRGHLFFTDGEQIAEFDGAGRRSEGGWIAGATGGSVMDLMHPFSNFDPLTMSGPAYRNVLPEEAGR